MPKVDIILKGKLVSVLEKQAKALVTHGIAKYPEAQKKQTYKTRHMTAENTETVALRSEYERAYGKKPFMGWDADTLKAKIADVAPDTAESTPSPEQHPEGADVPSAPEQGEATDSVGAGDNG